MYKSEIFAQILEMVSEETEVSSDKILSDNKCAEVVDARYILIKLLHDKGLYPSCIASELNCTARTIQHDLTHFSERTEGNPIMRINYEYLTKQTRNKDYT